MIIVPLWSVLVLFFAFLLVFLIFSFFNISELLKYGFLNFFSVFFILCYFFINAALLLWLYQFSQNVDWQTPLFTLDLSSFLPSKNLF